jgi:hypothetical protein
MNGGHILKPLDVIRTEDVSANFKDGKPIVLIESFTLIRDDITKMIGNPINYSDWEATKKNPNGDNTLPPRNPKNINMPHQAIKQPQGSNLSNSVPHSKPFTNQPPPKNNFPPQLANRQPNDNSNTTSNNLQNKNQQPSKPMQNHGANIPQQNFNQFNQPKQNPPQQQQNNRTVPPNKPQVDRHDRSYTMIKELYEGI